MATKTPAVPEERIGQVGRRQRIVVPREMLETLKLREGDLVAFTRQQNGILIKPKRVVDPDDVLTPDEARRLRRSLKETRKGKTRSWVRIKHELGL